jgi:two-component system NarL family sensor kinase
MRINLLTGDSAKSGVRRQLWLFYAVAAVVLIVVAVGALIASRSVAREQALKDAERTTSRLADRIGPLLVGALAGDARDREELDDAVSYRMGGDYLTEINVWTADGQVLYADNPDEIGTQQPAPAQVSEVIASRVPSSDFTTQPHANEETFDPNDPGFVEVYVPFDQPALHDMVFEAYYNYAPVDEVATSLFWELIPLVLLPLLILQLIQVPVTSSMARRLRRHESERASLMERTLSVSERERIRFAADLHDGPVQNLAGAGYALDSLASSVPAQYRVLMSRVQGTVHEVMASLRKLMVDLYPPDLGAGQLPDIIAGLAAPLREQGIMVTTRVGELPELSGEIVTALYRVARESLANVAEHAKADKVDITLGSDAAEGSRTATVLLRIIDDGVGVDPSRVDKRAEGHLGLRLLTDRVENLGGTLTVRPGVHGGTTVLAELPVTSESTPPPRTTRRGRRSTHPDTDPVAASGYPTG